jgi:hypothetical protein
MYRIIKFVVVSFGVDAVLVTGGEYCERSGSNCGDSCRGREVGYLRHWTSACKVSRRRRMVILNERGTRLWSGFRWLRFIGGWL